MIGTGGRARYQLLALLEVRPIERVTVWGRRRQAAEQYQRDMATAGVPICVAGTAHEAVQRAEVVITATSSTASAIEAGWLARCTHVTAVGSDTPDKQYVPDSIDAAADSGELNHALQAGLLETGSVYGELTAVTSGRLPGLGIQDAAAAALTARLADEHGASRDLPLGDK